MIAASSVETEGDNKPFPPPSQVLPKLSSKFLCSTVMNSKIGGKTRMKQKSVQIHYKV